MTLASGFYFTDQKSKILETLIMIYLVMFTSHVPISHGAHYEGSYGVGLTLDVPGIVEYTVGVGVVAQEYGHQAGQQVYLQGHH